ncbi:MAG: phenylalanine--tRNA ligase subunit beta [Thaumarchaeota archaeon]|nr:phenylalanine--tRNA ligase subunit beta [Nitrososphaerota archaeon]
MPVVRLDTARLTRMVGAGKKLVVERLPYLGLDIESVEKGSIRVEYSPNRPDFGSDFGIARALRGILGKEVGLPSYSTRPSGLSVEVDGRLSRVRPYIACATATGLRLSDEDIRQIIALQEDLHNGLGRRRRKVAVGLHDLDKVRPPLSYHGMKSSFKFRPLGQKREFTIRSILDSTEEGRTYGGALGGTRLYPVISDSNGTVLSFPPIINGDATKVSGKTKRMLIEVTSTDRKAGDDVLAIVATTLAEAGGKVGSALVKYTRPRTTPDLSPTEVKLDQAMVRRVIGLDLTSRQIADSLERSRMGVRGTRVQVPRYRIDLLHPVDLSEEVALGYGTDRIGPLYPASEHPGSFDQFEQFLDRASTIMSGMGMTELMTYELVDEDSLYSKFARESSRKISVQNPRSSEHSVLRDSLIPTMMSVLSANVKAEYPQRVYEIGRVYSRSKGGVKESWKLGCLIAHSQATYSEAKMHLEATCRTLAGKEVVATASGHWSFAPGRSAVVRIGKEELGVVGEVRPEALSAFRVNVPISGFELDLSALREQLK